MTEILYHRHELARTSGVVITCKKINECKVSADRCHIQAHCIDTAYDHSDGCELDSDVDCTPSYDCECYTGYEPDPVGSRADSHDKGPVCGVDDVARRASSYFAFLFGHVVRTLVFPKQNRLGIPVINPA